MPGTGPRLFLSSPVLLCAALLAPAAVPALHAQTGPEVMRTALERYEERMEGVDNYTVVQEVMGFESVTYFERTEVDGHAVFVPRTRSGSEAARQAPTNPYASFVEMAERAERVGEETVDGDACHVIEVTDFEGLDVWSPEADAEGGGFTPERATFLVDTDDYLIRRIHVTGTSAARGEPREVTFTADLRDYRQVEGLVHPFVTEVSIEGAGAQMSEEEQEEMRRSLEEMRTQMEQMPDQQRRMMERMMGGQLEKMEAMLARGGMDLSVRVTEIRVNEGPPDEGG